MSLKIYRLVYVYDNDPDAIMRYSKWTTATGMEAVKAAVLIEDESNAPPLEDYVEPTIIGWEEKELESPE